jgi:hypothetical protein
MRLSVVRGGGVAGMVTRTELDAAGLPPDAAAELHGLLGRAGLVADAPTAPSPTNHPDEQQYELRLEDEGVTRTVRVSDTTMPEPVRELLQWIDARPEREETIGPPGS